MLIRLQASLKQFTVRRTDFYNKAFKLSLSVLFGLVINFQSPGYELI